MTQEYIPQAGDLIRTRYLKIGLQQWTWIHDYHLVLEAEQGEVRALNMQTGTVRILSPGQWSPGDVVLVSRPEHKADGGQA